MTTEVGDSADRSVGRPFGSMRSKGRHAVAMAAKRGPGRRAHRGTVQRHDVTAHMQRYDRTAGRAAQSV